MREIEVFRRADRENTSRMLSTTPEQPSYYAGQQATSSQRAEVLKLPMTACPSLQDLDPASPTFGQLLFIAGISAVGGSDVIAG